MVTVWKQEAEKAEVQENGYLTVLQQQAPALTFRQDLNTFKAQGVSIFLKQAYVSKDLKAILIP